MKKHVTIFDIPPLMMDLPRPYHLGCESPSSTNYFWSGKNRSEKGLYLFQFTVSGFGCLQLGENLYKVKKNHGFLCRIDDPDVNYYYPPEATKPWIFIYITFKVPAIWIETLNNLNSPIYLLSAKNRIIQKMLRLLEGSQHAIRLSITEGHQFVCDLFAELSNSIETHATSGSDLRFNQAISFIINNIETTISVKDVADNIGVTPEHLCRLFRKKISISPIKYINRLKVQHACKLLLNSKMCIKEIANLLTFDNVSNFNRLFKSVTHTTPAKFRKRSY